VEESKQEQNKKRNRSLFIYVSLGLLIFFGVQRYNQTINAPENSTFSEFQTQINQGLVTEATIKEQSNTVEYKLANDDSLFQTDYPEGFEGEIFKLLIDQNIVLNTDSEPAGMQDYFIAFLPWIFLAGFMFFMFSQVRSNGNQIMQFGKSKAKELDEESPKVTFKDVAGAEEAKEELEEIKEFLKSPEKFNKLGAKIPKGVLLVGPPGTGKTLLAKAVAGESNVPFFSISGSDFVEMFVGVGASRVRDLFKKAKESSPAIIFIDEIDAVGRMRGAGLGGGHDEREQTLNQLLVEMDGFEANQGVILMAATNRPDVLDPALLRPGRFDRQVIVDRPDLKGRTQILKVHAADKPIAKNVSLETIAKQTPGFTGADLANLLNEAAILTARRRKDSISILEIDDSVDRIVAGMEGSPLTDGRSKRLIAYHEVGHALIGSLVKAHDPVQKVTVIPRGQAKGLTWFTPDDEQTLVSRAQLKARIMGALGGRAAEDVVFGEGEITTGAGGDFQQVASMARQMVTRFGMSNLGPIALESGNQEVFVGRDLMTRSEVSDSISKQIDESVRVMVKECYKETYAIVSKNREAMDKIVDLLIEKETLDGEEFINILSKFTTIPKKERTPQLLS